MQLIVGLGNPGPRYQRTRHNAGFLVLDALGERLGVRFRRGRRAQSARAGRVVLLKPTTFMNLSGQAVQAELSRLSLTPASLLVVHDDIDLPLGRLRFKRGGGAGGARGVRDIIERLGPDFDRLKIGVGRPPPGWATETWVLSRFREDEKRLLEEVVAAGADAVERFLEHGFTAAANEINGLDLGRGGDAGEP